MFATIISSSKRVLLTALAGGLLASSFVLPLSAFAYQSGAKITTAKGDIIIYLYEKEAPITVKNFKQLVERNFYSEGSMVFHRVVPGFVVQTGDPTNTGTSGSGKTIPLEVRNSLYHNRAGMVAMARSSDPNSASSQFYITLASQPALDGKYAIFGRVLKGIDVLPRIQQGDGMFGITLMDVEGIAPEKPVNPAPKTNLHKAFKKK
ncbi:MAG: peptidylprolyl isomerase [Candidatus Melainabacteria bacterium]|jgi:cyclophilin family peptidyl-prolyl cis-trans isomerase|nr:peptidylprolyl isomerase [Candidatus Melainabacteria bacterium]